jgi:hypothetical protein
MKSAAIGFRPHSGWTSLVVVSLEKGKPVVLLRERVHLVKTFSYSFRQPYHTAAQAPLEEGRVFLEQVRADARKLACDMLRSVQHKLKEADCRLTRAGLLLSSSAPLPSLEKILAAHPLIHTADGELFREALAFATGSLRLKLLRVREKELLTLGGKVLRKKKGALQTLLTALGRSMGSPWSQDEKFAALVAWLSLCSKAYAQSKPEAVRAKRAAPAI